MKKLYSQSIKETDPEVYATLEKELIRQKKTEEKKQTGKTDDPVRLYLRDMGAVELLSREGEIAIAKRIEAGREKMIGAICESPMTIRSIINWKDSIKDGTMLLRDIVDLEATYDMSDINDNKLDDTLKLIEEAGEVGRAILKDKDDDIIDGIGDMVVVLTNLAELCGTSIEECVEKAYAEISNRTGKMKNGTFVKD